MNIDTRTFLEVWHTGMCKVLKVLAFIHTVPKQYVTYIMTYDLKTLEAILITLGTLYPESLASKYMHHVPPHLTFTDFTLQLFYIAKLKHFHTSYIRQ